MIKILKWILDFIFKRSKTVKEINKEIEEELPPPIVPNELPPPAATPEISSEIPLGSHGVDISHHNKNVDFKELSKTQSFVFIKATEGETFIDNTFSDRWRELKTLGIKRGAYHFFRSNKNPISQARHFCRIMGELGLNDMAPVLDIETMDKQSKANVKHSCKLFLDEVELITGRVPIVYSYYSFLRALEFDSGFSKYPLWLARYSDKPTTTVPLPWKQWTFWQFAEDGKVEGITGVCDVNRYKERD